MKTFSINILFLLVFCVFLSTYTFASEAVKGSFLKTLLVKTESAIEQGRFQVAVANCELGYKSANDNNDTTYMAAFRFYKGLAFQKQANSIKDADLATDYRNKSYKAYTNSRLLSPNFAGVENNIALLYEEWGLFSPDAAKEIFLDAMKKDKVQARRYQMNYAKRVETGSNNSSKEFLKTWYLSEPENSYFRDGVIRSDSWDENSNIPNYMDTLIVLGKPYGAVLLGMAALQQSPDGSFVEPDIVIMTVVSVSRAGAYSTFLEWLKNDSLIINTDTRHGLAQLVSLCHSNSFQINDYGFWMEDQYELATSFGKLNPRLAIHEFTSGLARYYKREGDLPKALNYYKLSSEFLQPRVNPDVIIEWVELLSRQQDSVNLVPVIESYGARISNDKIDKLFFNDLFDEFEFHYNLAMNLLISKQGSKDSLSVAMVTYQLEQALDIAYNVMDKSTPELGDFEVQDEYLSNANATTVVVNLLAKVYEDAGNFYQADSLKLNWVENFIKWALIETAENIFERIVPDRIMSHENSGLLSDFLKLRNTRPWYINPVAQKKFVLKIPIIEFIKKKPNLIDKTLGRAVGLIKKPFTSLFSSEKNVTFTSIFITEETDFENLRVLIRNQDINKRRAIVIENLRVLLRSASIKWVNSKDKESQKQLMENEFNDSLIFVADFTPEEIRWTVLARTSDQSEMCLEKYLDQALMDRGFLNNIDDKIELIVGADNPKEASRLGLYEILGVLAARIDRTSKDEFDWFARVLKVDEDYTREIGDDLKTLTVQVDFYK